MRQANAALSHHGHEVAIAQFEAEVPTHAQDHDLLIEVAPFEQLLDGYERRHQVIIADGEPRFAPEPNSTLKPEVFDFAQKRNLLFCSVRLVERAEDANGQRIGSDSALLMINYKTIPFVLQTNKFPNPRRGLDYAGQIMLPEFGDYFVNAFFVWVPTARARRTGESMG